jgi:TPR repeat protein
VLESAARQGFLPAMNLLGYVLLYGKFNIPKHVPNGIFWLREAAEKGFADSQVRLAFCYEEGLGVPIDLLESYKWSKLAADQKHPRGLTCLGIGYLDGRGVPQDFALAYVLPSLLR